MRIRKFKKFRFDVTFYKSDITDPSVPQKIIDLAIREKGAIDILVNNAGVAQHGEIETYNDDLLNKIMNTNVDAALECVDLQ